jgi:hypothetical protein
MAKNKSSFEGQELAPMEPWRPEYAPQAVTSRRHPASTIVAFVLAAGFGLSIGGAFASQAGILPPLGGTESAVVADPSPDASVDPVVDPTLVVDATTAPTDVPVIDPAPGTDPVVIPPPAGGGSDDEDEDGDDDGEDDGDDDGEDEDGDDD